MHRHGTLEIMISRWRLALVPKRMREFAKARARFRCLAPLYLIATVIIAKMRLNVSRSLPTWQLHPQALPFSAEGVADAWRLHRF